MGVTKRGALRSWCAVQRRRKADGTLPSDRDAKLATLGFWDGPGSAEEKWASVVQRLSAFKARYGHCDVPWNSHDFPGLLFDMCAFRGKAAQGRLDAQKEEELRRLGLSLIAKVSLPHKFRSMLAALKDFESKHGHINLPWTYPPLPTLPYWVQGMGQSWRDGTLPASTKAALLAAGIDLGRGSATQA